MRVMVGWASGELEEVLALLTGQQARGVVRIVQAELAGEPLSSLLDREGQICTSTTFYGSGKRRGWKGKPEFRRALELARRDYRRWMLENGTGEALVVLASTAPLAAEALRQQIVGDGGAIAALELGLCASDAGLRANAARRLGETGLAGVVPALAAALRREREGEVREALVEALGLVAGCRDGDRRAAALGVLDRADVKTAAKQAIRVSEDDVDAAIERELARLASSSEGNVVGEAAGDGGAAGTGGVGGGVAGEG